MEAAVNAPGIMQQDTGAGAAASPAVSALQSAKWDPHQQSYKSMMLWIHSAQPPTQQLPVHRHLQR